MKNSLCFLYSCFFGLGVSAQTPDTSFVTIGTETGVLSKQQIADQYDYVFGTKMPVRWMFKWNPLSGLDQQGLLNLSAEHKLSPAFSVQLTYGIGAENRFDSLYSIPQPSDSLRPQTIAYHHINLQTRWYFDMVRRIREGKSANNFSGNYLALELAHTTFGAGLQGEKARLASNISTVALRFGVQRRLFKYGYFDVSYGMGARHSMGYDGDITRPPKRWDFFASTQFALGLALVRPKAGLQQAISQCDVLQCFREENRMWKIDLYELVRIRDNRNAKASLRIAYEQKLGESPFSVEMEGHAGANSNRSNINYYKYSDSGWNIGTYVQLRYYYLMKKQIAAGKSGNNLSGIYLAMHAAYDRASLVKASSGAFFYNFDGTEQSFRSGPVWGLQYRLFNHAFIDMHIGYVAGFDVAKGIINGVRTQYRSVNFETVGRLRVGLAF